MDDKKCFQMLQRAYDAHLSGRCTANTSGLDLCNEELEWLVSVGYVEITQHWTQGAEYAITPIGVEFMKPKGT